MASICKVDINSKEDNVLKITFEYLLSISDEVTQEKSEWPLTDDTENFKANKRHPTLFAIKQVTENTTEIHFNSFSTVSKLATYLTQNLQTKAVVNMYQSTTEASYWAYYDNGELLREVGGYDGTARNISGKKLDFESDNLGHDVSEEFEEDKPMYVFDTQDMDEYNNNVGIKINVFQESDTDWQHYRINNTKPWWQFW
jgi:hypothetical protein